MVFAKSGNTYYEAKIIQVKRPGELKKKGFDKAEWCFKVHYIGWSKAKDEFVSQTQIRNRDEHLANEKNAITPAGQTTSSKKATSMRFDITIPEELQTFLRRQQLQLSLPDSIPLALPAEDNRPTVDVILDRFLAQYNAGIDPWTTRPSPPTTTYTYIGELVYSILTSSYLSILC